MKTRITIYLIFLFFSISPIFAQLEIEGSNDYGRIFDLIYDATTPNKVYALTMANHILVSENNGESWEIVYSLPLGNSASIQQLKLTPDGTKLTFVVYTPNQPDSAIMIYDISTMEIVKTFPLPNQNVNAYVKSYDFYNDDLNVLLVDTSWGSGTPLGKTFYTSDGGSNWDEVYFTNNYDTVFINNVSISPNNPNKIFLARGNGSQGVEGGFFVSEDAGQTWEEKLSGIIVGPMAFDPSNDQNLLLATDISFGSTEENIYKSTDGGNTFNVLQIDWTDGILNCINVIRFNPLNPSQIVVLEENEIVISEDSGTTWQNFVYLDDDPEVYHYGLNVSFNPYNSEQLFISGEYYPFFSNDGGNTLTLTKTPFYSSTGNIDLYHDEDTENLYYGVQFGYVHRDLNSDQETAYDIMPLNFVSSSPGITQYADNTTPNRLYTFKPSFMGSILSVSDDNGATRNELTTIFKNKFTSVAAFPGQSNSILAAFGGYDPSEAVLKKYDFSDINNVIETEITLPLIDNINGILIDNNGKIIVSIGAKIYASIDEGVSWDNNSNGLEGLNPSADIIFDLKRDPFNESRLAIATSKGIFISNDGGENWEQKSTDIVFKVDFSSETEGAIVASTFSSQVSEFSLHYSTNNGNTWQTVNNEQLMHLAARSSTCLFEENSVKVYIGSFDLGLVSYSLDLTPLSSSEFNTENEVVIYPNPVKGVLNIQSKTNSISEVTIFNITGQELLKTKNLTQINVSEFESGTYLLKITTVSGNMVIKRLIIQ